MDVLISRAICFLFFCVVLTSAEVCQKLSSCSCKTSKGTIDLHGLATNRENPRFAVISLEKNTYQWEPCYNLNEDCQNQHDDVSICQKTGNNTAVIATQSTASFVGNPNDNDLQIQYKGGPVRGAVVSLVCSPDLEGDFTLVNEGFEVEFRLDSKYACIVTKTISAGSVLLIIFFVLLFLYFVLGMVYMKFVRGATGVEIIPNKDFWTSLPGLIKDGVHFTCRGCKTDTTYSQI